MLSLKNLKIQSKLMLLVGVLCAVIGVVAAVGVTKTISLGNTITKVDDVDTGATNGARLNQNVVALNRSEYRIAADPSAATLTATRQLAETNKQEFSARLDALAKVADADEARKIEDVKANYQTYIDGLEQTYDKAQALGNDVQLGDAQLSIYKAVAANRANADQLQANVKALVDHIDNRGTQVADAAKKDSQSAVWLMVVVSLCGIGGGVVMGWFLARFAISRPLNVSVGELMTLAQGHLEAQISGLDRKDECGDIAKGLLVFRDNALKTRALEAEAAAQKEQTEKARKAAMLQLADGFEKSVGSIVTLVSSAATEMQAASAQLSATAQQTTAQSVAVSAAAEEAGANVTSVAASTEELGASVGEIGRQVATSASVAADAAREAENAQVVVGELNETTASITDVVDLIAGLASQTNLLALNATIESARAGEAGKGFAVVAAEVKALASQTAKATTDISEKIGKIQEATSRASNAMRNIVATIETLNHSSSAIASAVEQQNAATQEIIQAVGQASAGTQEVTTNITGVAQAAEQTGEAAMQVQTSSSELADQAERLHLEMDKFLQTVRAA